MQSTTYTSLVLLGLMTFSVASCRDKGNQMSRSGKRNIATGFSQASDRMAQEADSTVSVVTTDNPSNKLSPLSSPSSHAQARPLNLYNKTASHKIDEYKQTAVTDSIHTGEASQPDPSLGKQKPLRSRKAGASNRPASVPSPLMQTRESTQAAIDASTTIEQRTSQASERSAKRIEQVNAQIEQMQKKLEELAYKYQDPAKATYLNPIIRCNIDIEKWNKKIASLKKNNYRSKLIIKKTWNKIVNKVARLKKNKHRNHLKGTNNQVYNRLLSLIEWGNLYLNKITTLQNKLEQFKGEVAQTEDQIKEFNCEIRMLDADIQVHDQKIREIEDKIPTKLKSRN